MKEGWENKKLGEVCNITMGQSPDSSTYNKEGVGLPFFQGCADFGTVHPRITTYCSTPKKTALSKDILMSVRAPIGTLNIASENCCIGRGLAAFSEINNISDYRFIFYFLKASQKDLQSKGTGATFKAIGKELIINYPISLPPLAEQQRIVEELDLLSSIIEKKKEQLKELDNLAQSIFYDMFGDPVTNEKAWEVKKLKETCTKINDGTHNSPINDKVGDYMYVTAKNIKKDGIILDNITFVSEEIHKSIYKRCNPEYGDVLYIKDGVTTGIATINSLHEEFSLLSSVALLKPGKFINNQFLKSVLNTPSLYEEIRSNMGGAAITRLTINKINEITIPLPPLPLQQKFASKIETIERQKELIKQSIKEVETLFNSRMNYYFN